MLVTSYLTQSYCGFGEPPVQANRHAQVRIEAIIAAAEQLATAPSAESVTTIFCLAFAIRLRIVQ